MTTTVYAVGNALAIEEPPYRSGADALRVVRLKLFPGMPAEHEIWWAQGSTHTPCGEAGESRQEAIDLAYSTRGRTTLQTVIQDALETWAETAEHGAGWYANEH